MVYERGKLSYSRLKRKLVRQKLCTLLNTTYSQGQKTMSEQSSSKSLRQGISELWQAFKLRSLSIYQTVIVPRIVSWPLLNKWFRQMTVCTYMLTLGAMIQRYFSTTFDFWLVPVLAVGSFWTTLLWLLVEFEMKRMKDVRSIIYPPDSK